MISLANTPSFPAGVGREINREMMVWDENIDKGKESSVLVTCWNGASFCSMFGTSSFQWHSHACELPAVEEKGRNRDSDEVFGKSLNVYDENSFVRDGVRYVSVKRISCHKECSMTEECGASPLGFPCPPNDKDGTFKMWKRAAQPRAMSSVEIAKRYGHPKLKVGRFEIESYAFAYNKELDNWGTDFLNESVLCGICAIDDLCEDVSRSPWFMPMVDENGTVTEKRV